MLIFGVRRLLSLKNCIIYWHIITFIRLKLSEQRAAHSIIPATGLTFLSFHMYLYSKGTSMGNSGSTTRDTFKHGFLAWRALNNLDQAPRHSQRKRIGCWNRKFFHLKILEQHPSPLFIKKTKKKQNGPIEFNNFLLATAVRQINLIKSNF